MKTPLGKLVTGAALWAVLCAPLAHADQSNADTAAVLAEIRDTLTWSNHSTTVTLNGCTLQIKTHLRDTCDYGTQPNWKISTIVLDEIREMEWRKYDDKQIL